MIDRSRWTVQYMQRVLATDPIGYWMQDEKQGLVSYDMVTARSDGARNGAYTGITLGQPGIGDGRTSALYDGANDYDDIDSAGLNAAFDGDTGSLLIWPRVFNVGVWTDGALRVAFELFVDGNNLIRLARDAVNNQVTWIYRSGAVTNQRTLAGLATVDFFSMGLTWDKPNDEVIAYFDGAQEGAIINGLGVWGAGAFARAVIGALSVVPANPWHGYLAHGAIWDRPLTPAEALSLGVL